MQCLALDIGSSTIKGAILNQELQTIERVIRVPFPDAVKDLPQGFHEVDPGAIVEQSLHVVRQLMKIAPSATEVYSCGQMGGVMLLDSDHCPVTNYISWRDQRTVVPVAGEICLLPDLRSQWSEQTFRDLGSELKPGSATALLHWLSRKGVLPEKSTPVSVGDYVVSRLCDADPLMHATQAVGMLHLPTRQWHEEALERIGLRNLQWPRLTENVLPVGQACIDDRRMTFYPVIGDQQAALRGIDLQTDELSINVSTGSQVSFRTGSFQPGQCQTRPWFCGEYLNTVTHIPAGRSLTVLEALLTELPRMAGLTLDDSWKLIAQAADKSTASGLRCDLSFFDSAMGSDGRIEGVTTDNLTVGNLFDAAFEFMADSYTICAKRLAEIPGWKSLAVSGGLVQSFPSLQKKLRERFPLPWRELPEQEETLLGLLKISLEQDAR